MSQPLASAITALLPAIIGAAAAIWVERRRSVHEQLLHEATHKAEVMAEATARHYLKNPKWTDRSFEHIKERLGGFADDELRKILVRAGAVRHIRKNGSEWWRLLDREAEAQKKKKEGCGCRSRRRRHLTSRWPGKVIETLSVITMAFATKIVPPSLSTVAIVPPTPTGCAQIVSDQFPVIHVMSSVAC